MYICMYQRIYTLNIKRNVVDIPFGIGGIAVIGFGPCWSAVAIHFVCKAFYWSYLDVLRWLP